MEKTKKKGIKKRRSAFAPFLRQAFFCVAHFFRVSFRRLENLFFSTGARGMSGRVASGAAAWREYKRAERNA